MSSQHRFGIVAASLLACLSSSCTLPSGGRFALGSPLQEGVRYEVRRAVGPKDSFEPWELRSVYFVLKPSENPTIAGTRSGASGVLSVRTTAYCHTEADHVRFGMLSAIGRPLKYGAVRSAAADWSRFPLGTRFRIRNQPGVIYEVDDYGSALVGSNTIDLYCPNRSTMNRWGVRNCDIEVVSWGSFANSLDQLTRSVNYAHVRQMVRDIQMRLGGNRQVVERKSATPATAMIAPKTLLVAGASPSL